jgi:leishmanolysin-like peptidase
MTSTSIEDSVLSNITLAFLQDTGWYLVDFTKAQEFKFGRNMGCGFIYSKCIVNNVSQFPTYYTTNLNNDGCYYDFTKRVFFSKISICFCISRANHS